MTVYDVVVVGGGNLGLWTDRGVRGGLGRGGGDEPLGRRGAPTGWFRDGCEAGQAVQGVIFAARGRVGPRLRFLGDGILHSRGDGGGERRFPTACRGAAGGGGGERGGGGPGGETGPS